MTQPHAIKDPVTKKLVVDHEDIKKVSLEHCLKVLERNPPKDEKKKKMFDLRDKLNAERMEENLDSGFEATKETFDEVLAKFKVNNKRSYDFLMNADDHFKETIFLLCRRIIEKETIPESFKETTLHQIWKRKPGTRM